MSGPVHIALLGSGFVAEFFMQGLENVNHQKVVVNYSRRRSRASAFANRWRIDEWTTDLDGLIGRNDIEQIAGDAGVGEVSGDTGAHGACAQDCDLMDGFH